MTRETRHSIEKRVDSLEETNDEEHPTVTFERHRVLPREQAEREGFEIIEVVDTPGDEEHVKVPNECTLEEKRMLDEHFDVEPDT